MSKGIGEIKTNEDPAFRKDRFMFKLLGRINRVLAVVGATLLLLISFSICYSVFTRALSVKSPIWIIQFNEYAMLWVTFLAVAWVLAEDNEATY